MLLESKLRKAHVCGQGRWGQAALVAGCLVLSLGGCASGEEDNGGSGSGSGTASSGRTTGSVAGASGRTTGSSSFTNGSTGNGAAASGGTASGSGTATGTATAGTSTGTGAGTTTGGGFTTTGGAVTAGTGLTSATGFTTGGTIGAATTAGTATSGGLADAAPDAPACGLAGNASTPVRDQGVALDYQNESPNPTDGGISFGLKLRPTSAEAIPLSELEVRYYFTRDVPGTAVLEVFYSTVPVTKNLVTIPAVPGADAYLSYTFGDEAGVGALTSAIEIKGAFHTDSYTPLNECNDFSFNPAITTYAPSDHVAVYRNGTLIWGSAPSAPAMPEAGTSDEGGATTGGGEITAGGDDAGAESGASDDGAPLDDGAAADSGAGDDGGTGATGTTGATDGTTGAAGTTGATGSTASADDAAPE